MNCKLLLDKNHDEEVLIYAHKETPLTKAIEKLVEEDSAELIGYIEREAVMLDLLEVNCFVVEDNKVFALTSKDKLNIRTRLYKLEEKLPDIFIKINQSCVANIKQIKSFDASIAGSILVRFKNGHSDYVSRRQIKNVKERLGI